MCSLLLYCRGKLSCGVWFKFIAWSFEIRIQRISDIFWEYKFSGLLSLDEMSFDTGMMIETVDTLTSDHTSVVAITLFVTLLCACIVIGHLLEENRWMNESITALIIVSNLYLIFVRGACICLWPSIIWYIYFVHCAWCYHLSDGSLFVNVREYRLEL